MENEAQEHPFELIVGSETGEIMNGDVPVRWCVTPELVKKLEDDNIKDPHILLVSATPNGFEMQRQLVPITELMTYVRFSKSGKMKLYGFIIDGAIGRKPLYANYNRKRGGEYETDIIFAYTGQPHDNLHGEYTRTDVTVEIPADVFGKEPGPWMKWFVNLWHNSSGRAVDECHFRRRAIIAFTLKWIPVSIWAIIMIVGRVVVTGGLALGGYYKGMKFLRSFRPFKYSDVLMHILDDVDLDENSFLVKRKHTYKSGEWTNITMYFTLAFFPLVLLLQAGIIWGVTDGVNSFLIYMAIVSSVIFSLSLLFDIGIALVYWIESTEVFEKMSESLYQRTKSTIEFFDTNNRWRYLKWIGYTFIAAIMVLFATIFAMAGIILIPTVILTLIIWKYSDAISDRVNNLYTIAPESNDYTEIRELLCPKDEANLKPDIHFIPPKQRTVRLWYLDMKNKVCKPMQR